MNLLVITVPTTNNRINRYTLVYSAKAHGIIGANRAITNEGDEVPYTMMTNEEEFGHWKYNYKWDDAFVVGYIEEYNQIISYNILRNFPGFDCDSYDFPFGWNYPEDYHRPYFSSPVYSWGEKYQEKCRFRR